MNTDHLGPLLDDLADRHQVPGAQLALHRDGVTVLVETGVERHGDAAPVSTRSAFPYGSVTKAFTATVVVQLAAAGDVGLDEPIVAHLPGLAGAPNGIDRLVTPRHLLSHTSGLPCDFDEPSTATTPRRHVLAARTMALVHPPGRAFSYSNAGFVLAGALVEEVTGMTWWDAVETLVLRPLDIEPAFCALPRHRPGRRPVVSGHSVNPRRTLPVEPSFPVADAPAGALAGSAADLVAFARAHLGETARLPHAREIGSMRSGGGEVTPFGLADGWGLGLARFRAAAADWFGHDGTTDGATCHLRFDPLRGVALVLTTNASCGLRLWEDVLAALGDSGLEVGTYPSPRLAGREVAEVPDCLGDYLNGDVRYSLVRAPDGAPRLDLDDGVLRDLTFYEGLRFRAEAPDELPVAGRLVRDPGTGEIELLEVGGRAARRCPSAQDGGRRKVGA